MKRILLLLLFTNLLLFSKTNVNINFDHYYISPKSVKEVKSELIKKTPIRIAGNRFLGQTKWKITYQLKSLYNVKECKLDSVNVNLDVTYIMPKVSSSTPLAIKYKFERYYKKLLEHEKNHKKNAYKAAKEIERKIRQKTKEKNCDILYRKIDKLSKNIIKKYERLDRLYDKRTQHGKSEGVVIDNYFK